jgi:hypothetical protein
MAQVFSDMTSVIEEIVRQELGSDRVERIHVLNELGSDDEPLLRVLVIYPDRKKRFAAAEMLRTLTAVRNHVRDKGAEAFPMLSFLPADEADQVAPRPS